MRLSECKENMSSFAEREHSRSYHAAKIQNIFDMVVTLQPFLVKFTRFLDHRGITWSKWSWSKWSFSISETRLLLTIYK